MHTKEYIIPEALLKAKLSLFDNGIKMIELALEAAPNICVFLCVSLFINIDWINCDYHLYKLCPCVCPQQIGVMFNDEAKRNN